MSMAKLLDPARVLANVEARSKKHAFEILSELIAGGAEDLSHESVFEALVERERIGNTGMGKGVAIPHGRVPELKNSVAAFLKLSEAIDFGAQDGEPVTLILAVAAPDDDEADNFDDVALGARTLADAALIEMLHEVSSSRALYELLAAQAPAENTDSSGENTVQSSEDDREISTDDSQKDSHDDTVSAD